ncbi:hypothetical protein OROGR_023648 [Orobanche gracilis]
MASLLQRLAVNSGKAHRSALAPLSRAFSTEDSLVEVKSGEVGMVSGIPQEHLRRRVLIFSSARMASQQGSGKVGRWKINFLSTQKSERQKCVPISNRYDRYHDFYDKRKATKFGFLLVLSLARLVWENPLMGWTSTGDPYANVGDAGLSFDSKEAAIAFAGRHGWDYTCEEAPHAVTKDNFKWKGPPKDDDEK